MPFLVLLIAFLLIVALPRYLRNSSGRAWLLKSGLEARGLVLSAERTGTQSTVNGQRFQVRTVLLDVEVFGRPPYEVSLSAMFPRLSEPFPGSALDLRVDPRNPNNIAIVGPAGASGWIGATAGLFPWANAAPEKVASGCGTVVIVLIALGLGFGAVVSFIGGSSGSRETPATPETPVEPTPTPHVAPHATPTVEPGTTHKICEEATRCCTTLGRAHCASFTTQAESTCKGILAEEKKAAAKVHKSCE